MTWYWLALVAGALIVGFTKSAISGLGTLAVALFASVMPARESTAAVLLVLLIGDLTAIYRYRSSADWALIRQLLPAVLPGIIGGTVVLAVLDDMALKRLIGGILAALLGLQLIIRKSQPPHWAAGSGASHVAGAAVGFTTMTANSAGPVMALFLVSRKVDKLRFIGTAAWFFFLVNLSKVPFSLGLGLFSMEMVLHAFMLAPLVLIGSALGVWTVRRIRQSHFDIAVLAASGLGCLLLLIG